MSESTASTASPHRVEGLDGPTPSLPAVAPSAAAIAALVLLSMVPLRGHATTYVFGGPLIAAIACVPLIAWRSWHVVDRPLLRPLVVLGTIPYGLYLWNYPVTLWLRPSMDACAGLAGIALSVAAAMASWRLVEEPIMLGWRSTQQTRTEPAGVAA